MNKSSYGNDGERHSGTCSHACFLTQVVNRAPSYKKALIQGQILSLAA